MCDTAEKVSCWASSFSAVLPSDISDIRVLMTQGSIDRVALVDILRANHLTLDAAEVERKASLILTAAAGVANERRGSGPAGAGAGSSAAAVTTDTTDEDVIPFEGTSVIAVHMSGLILS